MADAEFAKEQGEGTKRKQVHDEAWSLSVSFPVYPALHVVITIKTGCVCILKQWSTW